MLLLTVVGCVVASANEPARWEYATIDVFVAKGGGYVARTDPPEAVPALTMDRRLQSAVEALNAAGSQGWEVVAPLPDDVFLVRRQR